MADENGPELSWQTIVGALTAVGILAAAQWTIFQNQFSGIEKTQAADRAKITELKADLDKYLSIREHNEYREGAKAQTIEIQRRLTVLEAAQAKAAREPVENATFQGSVRATDDKITLLQNQMQTQTADLNLQLAAALRAIADAGRKPQP